ncbi:MAG: MazG family protein [Candidatus Bipolaricaulota bacterium]|nr:MazG family protein [Candidatus Bipolaricaulota bacterium]MCS7275095.1 MazG family protein [Candidatus Bipolaricaulota bacterium]MDW8110423.1 MazG family protein [Candidatus Bipolaricaulota bacterium]MDW8329725.1 MazG family protein [Candidatus Bipolaricaulota bacterium]
MMRPRSEDGLRRLVELVAHLRSERGCPWDRAQTHQSLKSLLIEEAYETVAAIESQDPKALQDELGDLLLHVAFHTQIAQEQGHFTLDDLIEGVYQKIVRRHPHVFGEERTHEIERIKGRWEEIKRREGRKLTVLSALPALIEARKLQERAAHALTVEPSSAVRALFSAVSEEALGQVLLEIVAVAREHQIDPELALKKATARFAQQAEMELESRHDLPE